MPCRRVLDGLLCVFVGLQANAIRCSPVVAVLLCVCVMYACALGSEIETMAKGRDSGVSSKSRRTTATASG